MADTTEFAGTARYQLNNRTGKYEVLARYNAKGLFRVVETWPTADMARKAADNLINNDDTRYDLLRDTKDWDFIANDVKQKRPRGRVPMSAEERERVKAERKALRRVDFSFD